MNILILSAGTRNLIVQYFKRTIGADGIVVATDMSPLAPAIYEADRHYIVPPMREAGYLDVILEIVSKEHIDGVLSLIDPELSLLAQHEAEFLARGARVIGSSYPLCERSLDKYQMYLWLKEKGYRTARSWVSPDAFLAELEAGTARFPVFVKPIRGSASISISKAMDQDALRFLFAREKDMMIQEFMNGQEIGADVYIDLISGEVVSIFTKKKLKMRAGETDKAVSFRDPALFSLIETFAKEAGYRGQIDIDLFDQNGTYYISEVNPRFGGGYPHAYACGCDHIRFIRNNLMGKANDPQIGQYEDGVAMMKYSELMVRRTADHA